MFVSSLFDTEKKKKKNFGEFFKEALYLGTQIKKKKERRGEIFFWGVILNLTAAVLFFYHIHGFSITIDEERKKKHHHRLSVRKGGTPKSVSRDI